MLPQYVWHELALRLASPRLSPRKLKAICRLLEIDLDAALNPGPTSENVVEELSSREAPALTGAVPFDFEVRCGNHVRQVTGRIVYASEGLNAIGETERRAPVRRSYGTLGNPRPDGSRCRRMFFPTAWSAA